MRKILFFIIMCFPMLVMAQGSWELPKESATPQVQQKDKEQEKAEKEAAKREKEAAKAAEKAAKQQNVSEKDKPYLKGAVPEVDGKVVFSFDIDAPGKSAAELYDITYKEMERLTKDEHQKEGSRLVLINKEEKTIVAKLVEWLVFSDKFLVLDRSELDYVMIAKCSNGKVNFTIERLIYKYDIERNPDIRPAEDIITDKLMLSKDGTKLKKMNSKFRKKTVDRINQIKEELARGIH